VTVDEVHNGLYRVLKKVLGKVTGIVHGNGKRLLKTAYGLPPESG
jgi:hypothetical protein